MFEVYKLVGKNQAVEWHETSCVRIHARGLVINANLAAKMELTDDTKLILCYDKLEKQIAIRRPNGSETRWGVAIYKYADQEGAYCIHSAGFLRKFSINDRGTFEADCDEKTKTITVQLSRD